MVDPFAENEAGGGSWQGRGMESSDASTSPPLDGWIAGENEHETIANDASQASVTDRGRGRGHSTENSGGIVHGVKGPSQRQPAERREETGCGDLGVVRPRDQVYPIDGGCRMVIASDGEMMSFDAALS